MKKSLLRTTFAFAAALIMFTACKKDKDSSITTANIAGNYRWNKVTFKADAGGGDQVVTSEYFDDCQIDNLLKLLANGEFEYVDEGVECGADYSGEWALIGTTQFDLDGSIYDIVSFDGSILVIASEDTFNSEDGTTKLFLKKQ